MSECTLEHKECTDCGECLICDLNQNKECDNCMECIEKGKEFRAITIDEVKYEE